MMPAPESAFLPNVSGQDTVRTAIRTIIRGDIHLPDSTRTVCQWRYR